MFDEFLIKAGLNKEQSGVYGALLEVGSMSARKIALKLGLKRGITYKILDQLIDIGLVVKNEKLSKIALFFPTHPGKIKELLEKKTQELKTAEGALQGVMGQMVSSFNLVSGKPNVQFFEGERGVREVLADSLLTNSEILSYADIEAIQKYIPKINEWYVNEREKNMIKKRGLVLDNDFTKKFLSEYHKNITDTRLIKSEVESFQTIMQIYDNKISYITLSEKEMIGVIVESASIAKMHKYLFEVSWNQAAKELSS